MTGQSSGPYSGLLFLSLPTGLFHGRTQGSRGVPQAPSEMG